MIDRVYKRRDPDQPNVIENLLPIPADVLGGKGAGNGGYISSQDLKTDGLFPVDDPDDHWWVPSGRIFFSPDDDDDTSFNELTHAVEHFYLPHRYQDAFGNTTTVTYDIKNYFLIVKIEDPIGNIIIAEGRDYRLLQPFQVTNPNQNRSMVAFDVLGMVVGTAIMGKPASAILEGDNLDNFNTNLTTKEIRNHITDPLNNPHSILKNATTRIVYDLFSYYRTKGQADPEPIVIYTLVRETHFADVSIENQNTKIQHSFSYSDGFGREIQKKIQLKEDLLILTIHLHQ